EGGKMLGTCEASDVVRLTWAAGRPIDRAGVRVIVGDGDSSDDDPIGDVKLGEAAGALSTHAITTSGAAAWLRFRPLWIALAIGFALAAALAVYRRRHVA